MSATFLVAVEGVLRKPGSGEPLSPGLSLYRTLVDSNASVFLLTDEVNTDHLDQWLTIHSIHGHLDLIGSDSVLSMLSTPARRAAQVKLVKTMRPVDIVVEPDPSVAARLVEEGITVLLFANPEYADPMWRPDYKFTGPTPWDTLADELTTHKRLRESDRRAEIERETSES